MFRKPWMATQRCNKNPSPAICERPGWVRTGMAKFQVPRFANGPDVPAQAQQKIKGSDKQSVQIGAHIGSSMHLKGTSWKRDSSLIRV